MEVVACRTCNPEGSLHYSTVWRGCSVCYGAGFISRLIKGTYLVRCLHCGGDGGELENGPGHTTNWIPCRVCLSKGVIQEVRDVVRYPDS